MSGDRVMGGYPVEDPWFDSTTFRELARIDLAEKLFRETAEPIEHERHAAFRRFWLSQRVRRE